MAMTEAWARRHRTVFEILRERARARPWDGQGVPARGHQMIISSPEDPEKTLSVLLTFDVGYHASGWWRNSDYDRCWHLSMVVVTPWGFETPTRAELEAVASAIFGPDLQKAWIEPPASAFDAHRTAAPSRHTYHVRVFVDRRTGEAIVPRGEVYDLVPWPEGDSPQEVYR